MENTVVGVYDSYPQAQNAMNELLAHGFSRDHVHMNPSAEEDRGSDSGGIGHFFRSMFGMEEHHEHRDAYSEAVRRGSVVVAVDTDSENDRERAVEILSRFYPADIDERAAHWKSQGWTGYDENAPALSDSELESERNKYAQTQATTDTAGEKSKRIPVVEEDLQVGKREVQRGGVRVYQRVSEKPVHESVELREEHVNVERHAVDKPATEADMAAFKEGSVEMREMAEEPVVSKTARVVEEVVVGKDVTQETQDIDDKVRRTDVDVEQIGAQTTRGTDYADTRATADDADYRKHWQNAYGQSGKRYEDYDAAYRYGSTMAGSGQYQNYRWEDAEPQMRSDWESRHPESTWEQVKDAVRYGAERVKGREQRH